VPGELYTQVGEVWVMEDKDMDNMDGESFADLLDAYSNGMSEDIQVGDKVKGKILSIGVSTVFVDTGTKIDGTVEKEELLDENQEFPYLVGDMVELFAVSVSESEIQLSMAISGIGGLEMLRDAYENSIPVEGKVSETCKGGFRVETIQRRAFCPVSQMDTTFVENPEDHVGKSYQFLITRFEDHGKNIVVSRRKLLDEEQKKAKEKFFKEVETGAVLEGKVVKLMPYGAFVALIPGVEGLVHVSELSWSRVEKPGDILKEGDRVSAKILGIEDTDKSGQKKISLSMKQLEEDPWNSSGGMFRVGEKVTGKVTNCLKFGAFVEIAPGIEGLVHISEMSYTKRVLNPEDIVSIGESVSVVIKEFDGDKRRINLSLKDAEGDPWLDLDDKYKVGQSVNGIIEKKENFGFFINIEPGITGLLPSSKIKNSTESASIEKMKEGGSITVIIEQVDKVSRKISLAPGDSRDEGDWQTYMKPSEKPVGSLGEKLQQALDTREKVNKD